MNKKMSKAQLAKLTRQLALISKKFGEEQDVFLAIAAIASGVLRHKSNKHLRSVEQSYVLKEKQVSS